MIERWDEIAINYLNDELIKKVCEKSNSFEYFPSNNGILFYAEYENISNSDMQILKNYLKEAFKDMTVAQIVTTNNTDEKLMRYAESNLLELSGKYYMNDSEDKQSMGKDLLRYATYEFANHLLSLSTVEMLSDYKSIMLAMEFVTKNNIDLECLELKNVTTKLESLELPTKLNGIGVRGRAELWRLLRAGVKKDSDNSFCYALKSKGVDIEIGSSNKYQLRNGYNQVLNNIMCSALVDVEVDKDLLSNLRNDNWYHILQEIRNEIKYASGNNLNLYLDTIFTGEKGVLNKMNSILNIGVNSSYYMDSLLKSLLRTAKENTTMIKVIDDSLKEFLNSPKAVEKFDYIGFYKNLITQKIDGLSNLKCLFENDEPLKDFSYEIKTTEDKKTKYIFLDLCSIMRNNFSLNKLIKNNIASPIENAATLIMDLMDEMSIDIYKVKVNSLENCFAIPLERSVKNGEDVKMSSAEVDELIFVLKNTIQVMVGDKNLSKDEIIDLVEKRMMEKEVALSNRCNVSAKKVFKF